MPPGCLPPGQSPPYSQGRSETLCLTSFRSRQLLRICQNLTDSSICLFLGVADYLCCPLRLCSNLGSNARGIWHATEHNPAAMVLLLSTEVRVPCSDPSWSLITGYNIFQIWSLEMTVTKRLYFPCGKKSKFASPKWSVAQLLVAIPQSIYSRVVSRLRAVKKIG